jgi:hypothetical protein
MSMTVKWMLSRAGWIGLSTKRRRGGYYYDDNRIGIHLFVWFYHIRKKAWILDSLGEMTNNRETYCNTCVPDVDEEKRTVSLGYRLLTKKNVLLHLCVPAVDLGIFGTLAFLLQNDCNANVTESVWFDSSVALRTAVESIDDNAAMPCFSSGIRRCPISRCKIRNFAIRLE